MVGPRRYAPAMQGVFRLDRDALMASPVDHTLLTPGSVDKCETDFAHKPSMW